MTRVASRDRNQELQVETGIGEFRQTLGGRTSPTLVIFYPKRLCGGYLALGECLVVF